MTGTIRQLLDHVALRGSRPTTTQEPSYVQRAVSRFDTILQRRGRVYEFTRRSDCLLRCALDQAASPVALSDGTTIRVGDPVLDLHLWNEHIPRIAPGGPNLAWARLLRRRFEHSFDALAFHVAHDPRCREVRAIRGRCAFVTRDGREKLMRLAQAFELDMLPDMPAPDAWQRFHDFWENAYILGLIMSFNPTALRRGALRRERHQLWISRARLIARYRIQDRGTDGDRTWS